MDKSEIKKIIDSYIDVLAGVASNPNTQTEVLTELAKDERWDVRAGVASNQNTQTEVLTELAKDSDSDVRARVASNPNYHEHKDTRVFIVTDSYVATQGTNHLWYKHQGINFPFYACGCFIGSREQLLGRITIDGGGYIWNERMRILSILDKKFDEIFIFCAENP